MRNRLPDGAVRDSEQKDTLFAVCFCFVLTKAEMLAHLAAHSPTTMKSVQRKFRPCRLILGPGSF